MHASQRSNGRPRSGRPQSGSLLLLRLGSILACCLLGGLVSRRWFVWFVGLRVLLRNFGLRLTGGEAELLHTVIVLRFGWSEQFFQGRLAFGQRRSQALKGSNVVDIDVVDTWLV